MTRFVAHKSRSADGTVVESVRRAAPGRRGDARTAAEKAADRLKAAQTSTRRFSLRGAWAGGEWICNCVGRLHHGEAAQCRRCELRRPGMRHWMVQSVRWGTIAVVEHLAAARAYLDAATFSAPFHGGLPTLAVDGVDGYRLLVEQVARDFHVSPTSLVDRVHAADVVVRPEVLHVG